MKDYHVVFKYLGKEPHWLIKDSLEAVFMYYYNIWCDIVNPLIEPWNNEFEDSGLSDNEYDSWFSQKEEKIAKQIFNSDLNARKCFKRFLIGNECQFQAELHNGTIMMFYLK